MPSLEPAARGTYSSVYGILPYFYICLVASVSVQTVLQTVNGLVAGISRLKQEVQECSTSVALPNDRFVQIMKVCFLCLSSRSDDVF